LAQIGIVSGGGITYCGNPDIPDYYVRLDHPEISSFIRGADVELKGNKDLY
jgi:hypothetical protein